MNCKKVLALSLLCSLPLLANAQTVRIVTDVSYPPFSKVNPDGTIVGFDPDIARAICAEAKLQCEVSTMDFDGIIPAVQAKKYDLAIASMNITPERAKAVDFSDMYFNIPGRLIAKAGTKIDDAWFKGKTIGVVATDGILTKAQAHRLAIAAHDGLARSINPVHTMSDGDTLFSLGTGRAGKSLGMMVLATMAAEATARATVRAVQAARSVTTADGLYLPAMADLRG